MAIPRATLVMEQHLGHQTYYENLRRFIESEPMLAAHWVPVTYRQPDGLWERMPFIPANLRGTLRGRSQVRHGLQQQASDVLFFNTQVPAVLGGALTRKLPYLIATDITPLQYDQLSEQYGHRPDRFAPLRSLKRSINQRFFQQAVRVLPWSTWTRTSLIKDYAVSPERIEVIPPGVDLERWRPGPTRAAGPLQILFVGGDLYRKGGDTLLRAFRTLPTGSAELHLVTRTRIAQEAGVRLYHDLSPNTPALIALYQAADVFVLPTKAEAFGIAAVEATASGLAAIVTAVGGLADIVSDRENGFQIPPGDSTVLSECLRLLAANPALRVQMGQAGRARAEALFDARRNALRVAACLCAAAEQSDKVRHALV
jgi:glycosyltransferase involved in cell wall biosynthesis